MKYYALLLSLFLASCPLMAQIDLDLNFNLELAEKDSVTSELLRNSLSGFLAEAKSGNYSEVYVDSLHRAKHEFFFSKLSKIGLDTTVYFDPTILKSYSEDGQVYWLTVGFYGNSKGQPFIFQITDLKAVPYQGHYRFECVFDDRVAHYNTKTIDDLTYHYIDEIDEQKAQDFAAFRDEFIQLSNGDREPLDYYCFRSLDEMLKAYGFLYSARQCNFLYHDLGFMDNDGRSFITGAGNEDYRAEFVANYLYYHLPSEENLYWTFATGLSIYYGGYFLSQDNLAELKAQFRQALVEDPKLDFLAAFKKGRKSSIQRHFTHYVISAFICEEILRSGTFSDIKKLLYSGSNGDSFFQNLKEVTGIDEESFHQRVLKFIEAN